MIQRERLICLNHCEENWTVTRILNQRAKMTYIFRCNTCSSIGNYWEESLL